MRLPPAPAFALLLGLLCGPALATDTVTTPFVGVTYTHRSTQSPRKEIHIVTVDLTRPELSIRTTRSGERGRTPSSFANLVGAAVVVNGDFFQTDGSFDPSSLAIGQGTQWTDGTDSSGVHFIACTQAKACTIETGGGTTAADPSWFSAVGGRRILVKPGAVWTSDQDTSCGEHCTTLHPRTAVGLKDGGDTLVLVLVEGRQDPVFGMKISQLATLMSQLGCETAMELDGGGSSTLVVDGDRVSGRPDNEPGERAVANHLAVLFDPEAATTGELVGFIREADIMDADAGIDGASVALSDGQSTTANADGYYSFAAVAPGAVTVTASADGFTNASETKDVTAGITNWKSIALTPVPAGGEGEGEGDGGGEGEGEDGGDDSGEGEGEGESGDEGTDGGEAARPSNNLEADDGAPSCTSTPGASVPLVAALLALSRWRRRMRGGLPGPVARATRAA